VQECRVSPFGIGRPVIQRHAGKAYHNIEKDCEAGESRIKLPGSFNCTICHLYFLIIVYMGTQE